MVRRNLLLFITYKNPEVMRDVTVADGVKENDIQNVVETNLMSWNYKGIAYRYQDCLGEKKFCL